MIFGDLISKLCAKMHRIKKIDEDVMETPLKRCLTTFDLTLLGVGHMIGAGIYVLTGTVAHSIAGPGVILSFLLAGVASALAALCYAEFGASVPKAGSAYIYTFVVLGEFWAFIIGWNLILEHMIGAASVARAWSGYVDSLAGGAVSNFTRNGMKAALAEEFNPNLRLPDPLAAGICLLYAFILACGVKGSATINSILTLINLTVMTLVIGLGFAYADISNWREEYGGFLPWGFSGVVAGAGVCLYAFVGFDSIATAGEEAKDPGRSIPLATAFSLIIVAVGYILVSGTLTLVVPYFSIKPTAALAEAFASKGVNWAKYVISTGALCGMTTTLFGSLFSLPRIMYAMASDGLLFKACGLINERTQIPVFNLVASGTFTALIALFCDLHQLIEFMSIGTFLAYTIVATSVIIMRYRPLPVCVTSALYPTENSTNLGFVPDERRPSDMPHPLVALILSSKTGTPKPCCHWLVRVIGFWPPGTAVVVATIAFVFISIGFSLIQAAHIFSWVASLYCVILMICCLVVIFMHQQAPPNDKFRVPLVPFVPALSILLNIYLMVHLSSATWYRFLTWMFIGIFVYFVYGLHGGPRGERSYATLTASTKLERMAKYDEVEEKLKQLCENNLDVPRGMTWPQ